MLTLPKPAGFTPASLQYQSLMTDSCLQLLNGASARGARLDAHRVRFFVSKAIIRSCMNESMVKLLQEAKVYIINRLKLSQRSINFATLRAGCMYDSDVLAAALEELLAAGYLACVRDCYCLAPGCK